MKYSLVLAMVLAASSLGGCVAPIHGLARDPVTGQIEACTTTMSVISFSTHCTDGTSASARPLDNKPTVVARDRNSAVVTCGQNFNGAVCWPSVKASRPAPDWCKTENLVWQGDKCMEKK